MADVPLRLAVHPEAAELVAKRAGLLRALRGALDERGFLEADVPSLLPFAGQEPYLDPPAVTLGGFGAPMWLQTSPELTLKRLVCAGVSHVYALGPAFRGGRDELARHHQPQFTMLEWYRPGTTVDALFEDCVMIGAAAAAGLGVPAREETLVLSLSEAFDEWAGLDLEPLLDGDVDRFADAAKRSGLEGARAEDGVVGLVGRVLVERIEPALRARRGWVFLHGYPAALAALAETDPEDPRLALRGEAYLDGVELANGYVELTDGDELARRWEQDRRARDGVAPSVDTGLVDAFGAADVPPTVGMALGVDRLAMVLLGHDALRDVLPLHLSDDGP